MFTYKKTLVSKHVATLKRRRDYLESFGADANSYDQAERAALTKVLDALKVVDEVERTLNRNALDVLKEATAIMPSINDLETMTPDEYRDEVDALMEEIMEQGWDQVNVSVADFTAYNAADALVQLSELQDLVPRSKYEVELKQGVTSFGSPVYLVAIIDMGVPNLSRVLNSELDPANIEQEQAELNGIVMQQDLETAEARAAELVAKRPHAFPPVYRVRLSVLLPMGVGEIDGEEEA